MNSDKSFIEKLNDKSAICGIISPFGHPAIVEICSLAGFDFYVLDGEHGALPPAGCESALITGRKVGLEVLVRVPENNQSLIGSYLDLGASGIIVPHVSTLEDTVNAVRATRYHPKGRRGIGPCRANNYGLREKMDDYIKRANIESVVFIQIETIKGVENYEKISQVEGLNGVIIGPRDLATDLGYAGDTNAEEVRKVIDKIIGISKKNNLPIGLPANNAEHERLLFDRGAKISLCSLINLLYRAMVDYVGHEVKY